MSRLVPWLFRFGIGAVAIRSEAAAQQIVIQVTSEASSRPVAGALLTVTNEKGDTVRRLLANILGRATVDVPAGRYQVKADAVGFSTTTSAVISLAAGETARVSLSLIDTPFVLSELVVKANLPCDRVDAEPQLSKVWNEARKGLLSTTLSTDSPPLLERIRFSKKLTLDDEVSSIEADTILTATKQPFQSADPLLLHESGFIIRDPDAKTGLYRYFAPDGNLLLSEQFLLDHCFLLIPPKKGSEDRLGLRFRPNKQRKRLPEVEGTLWLDPTTSELQTLEFRYINFTMPRGSQRIGGKVTFNRIPTGEWIISYWSMRAPLSERSSNSLSGYREEGGSARPIALLKGVLSDSATGTPIANAIIVTPDGPAVRTDSAGRFTLASRRGGTATVSIEIPVLETAGARPLTRTVTWPVVGETATDSLSVPVLSLIRAIGCPSMTGDSPLGMIVAEARDPISKRRLSVSSFSIQMGDSLIATGSATDGLLWGCSLPVGRTIVIKAKVGRFEVTHTTTVPASKVAIISLKIPAERR